MKTKKEFREIAKSLIRASFPNYCNEIELLLLEDNITTTLFSVHKDTIKFAIDYLVDQSQLFDKKE